MSSRPLPDWTPEDSYGEAVLSPTTVEAAPTEVLQLTIHSTMRESPGARRSSLESARGHTSASWSRRSIWLLAFIHRTLFEDGRAFGHGQVMARSWPISVDRTTRAYGRERLSAVLRIWLPNDGGRRNPTLALFLTNGRSTLELDLADIVDEFSMGGNGRSGRHRARTTASASRESELRAHCCRPASSEADLRESRQTADLRPRSARGEVRFTRLSRQQPYSIRRWQPSPKARCRGRA